MNVGIPRSCEARIVFCLVSCRLVSPAGRRAQHLANHVLDNGVPFLVYAANSGRAGIVELLVRDRVCLQSHLDLALNGASDQGRQEVMRVLLDNGANANFDPEDDGATPREIIDSETVRYLIEKRIDVNAKDNSGLTPLELAKQSGQDELIDALIKHAGKRQPRKHDKVSDQEKKSEN